MTTEKLATSGDALPGLFASAFEYLVDTGQRSVLFLDVMRERGIQYREHLAETAPNVLNYAESMCYFTIGFHGDIELLDLVDRLAV